MTHEIWLRRLSFFGFYVGRITSRIKLVLRKLFVCSIDHCVKNAVYIFRIVKKEANSNGEGYFLNRELTTYLTKVGQSKVSLNLNCKVSW